MNKEFYTVDEAAKILGMRDTTLRTYISDGRINSTKIANSRVLLPEHIREFEEKRK